MDSKRLKRGSLNMPILCLEGTSAVGKSTTCKAFASKHDAFVVEETQFLFGQTSLQGLDLINWFLECQVKRWKIALEKSKQYEYVLLDGDVLKLWYDWVYGSDEKMFEYQAKYLRNKIISNEMSFPYGYVVFWADQSELRIRKESDKTRRRGGFEKHLKLVNPQIKYFTALDSYAPGYVGVYKAETVEGNVSNIEKQILRSPGISPENDLELYDHAINFFRSTTP
jgi:hypothetical protein